MRRASWSTLALVFALGCGNSNPSFFGDPDSGSGGNPSGGSPAGGSTTGGNGNGGSTATGSGGTATSSGGSGVSGGRSSGGSGASGGKSSGGTGGSVEAMGGMSDGGASGASADGGSGAGAPPMGGMSEGGSADGGTSASGGSSDGGMGGAAGGAAASLESGTLAMPKFKGSSHCETVPFTTPLAAEPYDIGVLLTVRDMMMPTQEPLVAWVESITIDDFELCVAEDGGDDSHAPTQIHWLAYNFGELPAGALGAREVFSGQKGLACAWIPFDQPFATPPQMQASINHEGGTRSAHEPATTWFERIDETGFMLCVEELEKADGALDDVNVDWLAYPATNSETTYVGEADFPKFEATECFPIETGCMGCNEVQLTLNHRRSDADQDPHDAALIWAQDLTPEGRLTACVREIAGNNNRHNAEFGFHWLVRRP